VQRSHSGAETGCVERVDGEGSVAALSASDAAGEKTAGSVRGIGEGCVNYLNKPCVADLDELARARGEWHEGKDNATSLRLGFIVWPGLRYSQWVVYGGLS
ncbi:MAG: hypothetical protein WCC31_09930, partial [Terracidiphilus sp.]